MPIRVEHGPNLAPVGKLAYQTGQLEYRNKRRTELERLAMQQAEMRQRAQMQQRQLAQQAAIQQGNWGMDQQRMVANVKQNKQAHDNAMARLKQGQEFGVINAEQANQWGLAAAENKREHDIFLADKSNQAIMDRAAAAAGIADQSALKRMGQKAIVDSYENVFNPQGQQWMIGQLQRIEELKTDDRLTQEQKDEKIQQIHGELQEGQTNPLYTTLGPAGIGSVSPWLQDNEGRSLLNRVKTGEGAYEFRPPKTYKVEETNPETGVKSTVEKNWDPDEYFKATHKIVDIDGNKYERFLNGTTGAWEVNAVEDKTLEIVKAYGDYTSDFNSNTMNIANQASPLDFNEWKVSRGFGGQAPDPTVPLAPDQVVPLDPAAQAAVPQAAQVHEDGTPVPGAPMLQGGQPQMVMENPEEPQDGGQIGMPGVGGVPNVPLGPRFQAEEPAGEVPPQNLVFNEETRQQFNEGTQGNPRQVQDFGDRDMMILNGNLKVGDSYELPPAPDGSTVVAIVTEEMLQKLRSGGQ